MLPWRSRAANFLWFGRSVRTQILMVYMALSFVAASVAGGIIVYRTGVSTRIEIAASMRLAKLMVNEAAQLIQQQGVPAEPFLNKLPEQMRFVRHVRVQVRELVRADGPDGAGQPDDITERPGSLQDDGRPSAPAWFAMLIGPPMERYEVAIEAGGRNLGAVEIISEPHDEIAEAWGNTIALAVVAMMTVLAIGAILYFALGRVLDPLRELGVGLHDLEGRNYRVRLKRPKVLEFAAIVDRFNALAGALDAVRTENLALNRRLLTAQDDERRRTALELHDEVGPSLFGLKANVASIAKAAAVLPAAPAAAIAERVSDLTAIIDHLQGINRGLLNRLRPMALGHVPLADIIAGLVQDRAREHPHIAFTHDIGPMARGYDDTIDLTVYRCIQESLTNAIRHARATSIAVKVAVDASGDADAAAGTAAPPAPRLELTVRDDGAGIPAGWKPGFGLSGMRERVQALGGEFAAETGNGKAGNRRGACVRIVIPLPPRPDSAASSDRASTAP